MKTNPGGTPLVISSSPPRLSPTSERLEGGGTARHAAATREPPKVELARSAEPPTTAAYRRLAVAILGLDVATLARELHRRPRRRPGNALLDAA